MLFQNSNHTNHNNMQSRNTYTIKNFLPLIAIFLLISAFTIIKQLLYGFNIHMAMIDFMGAQFVVFGLFKIINIHGFAQAYSMYDILAKRSTAYAYAYPFIELSLGIAYLLHFQLIIINLITVILMIIGSIGVALKLAQGKTIECACLGTVFKLPMTYITLAENMIMGLMAFSMLLWQ